MWLLIGMNYIVIVASLLTTGAHQGEDPSRLSLAADRPQNPLLRHVHAYLFEGETLLLSELHGTLNNRDI